MNCRPFHLTALALGVGHLPLRQNPATVASGVLGAMILPVYAKKASLEPTRVDKGGGQSVQEDLSQKGGAQAPRNLVYLNPLSFGHRRGESSTEGSR